jgi:hypothetical protein
MRSATLITERYTQTRPAMRCPLCSRAIRVGQYTLRLKTGARWDTNVHASCLKEWVVGVPEDETPPLAVEAEFQRIRRELVGFCSGGDGR